MRVMNADIGHVYHVHKNYVDYLKDIKGDWKTAEKDYLRWTPVFSDLGFFCLIGMHGWRSTGQIWGYLDKDNGKVVLDGFFVKRGFRNKRKFLVPMYVALKDLLKQNGIKKIECEINEAITGCLTRKKFKVSRIMVERDI